MDLVGERKALSSLILAFYALNLLGLSLMPPDDSLRTLFLALTLTYGVAFFGLVAGYFWARWYAIGIGLFGLGVGVLAMLQEGVDYPQLFLAGTHGLVSIMLWGNKVAADFDGRSDWRARFHMDESATHRLGNAVIRAGASLPILIIYALAPRPDMTMAGIAAGGALIVVGLGLVGMLRMRTWGVLAMLGGGLALLGSALSSTEILPLGGSALAVDLMATGAAGALLLLTATLPFAGSMVRHLRG